MIISLTGAHPIRQSCASLFKIIPTPLWCISSATEYRFTSPVTSPVEVRTLPEPNYLASLTPKILSLKHLISFTTLTVANIACTFQQPILKAHLWLAIETLRSRTPIGLHPCLHQWNFIWGFTGHCVHTKQSICNCHRGFRNSEFPAQPHNTENEEIAFGLDSHHFSAMGGPLKKNRSPASISLQVHWDSQASPPRQGSSTHGEEKRSYHKC